MTTTSRLAGGTETEARTALTAADQLRVLADWLEEHAVDTADMYSAAVTWRGVLETHFKPSIAGDSALATASLVTEWVDSPSVTATPYRDTVQLHVTGQIWGNLTVKMSVIAAEEREVLLLRGAVALRADHHRIPVPLGVLRRLADTDDQPALIGPLTADQLAAARATSAIVVDEIKGESLVDALRAAGSAVSDGLVNEVRKFAEADRAAEERADDRAQVHATLALAPATSSEIA